jgi:uncharacterized protein YyaL (SSP411 family)
MNRLSKTTSPYLLQHADNPVDWYPWGIEALEVAKSQNKVIFLSIGYAACHWCHVMAHESFEDPETAEIMNTNFINIKVDREERPDLDSIYMAATIAMTGSGGWPMSVFLTPDLKPFYCGTYFPPERRFNLPSFREILTGISLAWKNDHHNIMSVGERVVEHIKLAETNPLSEHPLDRNLFEAIDQNLMQSFDWGFGGWGQAPKFPQPMAIEYLLARGGNGIKAPLHTLSCMARGGMYDVVGGGFARYSTDNSWRVPHFEKMLYDNAQLTLVYLHAWQTTRNPEWKKVVEETLSFVTRELTNPEGGFYSSLDADSEHEEGKYYVWSYEEIKSIVGDDFGLFKAAYGLTEQGNWEGKIILQRVLDDATLAARFFQSLESGDARNMIIARLSDCHSRLLAIRQTRVRPGTDDKILTSWNALMVSAFACAARAFHDTEQGDKYRLFATKNAKFLLTELCPSGKLRRAWRNGKTTEEVFLEDYAALILALIELYQTDFDNAWFIHAFELTEQMISLFNDPSGGFFDTPEGGEQLIFRPKDLQDNATPSGNSMACEALLRMAALTGRADFRHKADSMLEMVAEQAVRYPLGFSRWLSALDFALSDVKQIAIIGDLNTPDARSMINFLQDGYHPHWIIAASSLPLPEQAPELLHNRSMIDGKATAYVCQGFVCKQPVADMASLRKQLTD